MKERNINQKEEIINSLVVHEKDNVATTTCELEKGASAVIQFPDGKRVNVAVTDKIPKYHKLALTDISPPTLIIKYGYPIGHSIRDIKKGEHVHTQNMVSEQEGKSI